MLNRIMKAAPAAAIAGCFALALPAGAEPVSTSISIRGVVPTICRVEFSQPAAPVDAETVELGRMSELCNDVEGYRVVMQHPAGLQQARFVINGVEVPLSSGTETVVVDSRSGAWRTSDAKLKLASGSASINMLSFRTEPKGAIY